MILVSRAARSIQKIPKQIVTLKLNRFYSLKYISKKNTFHFIHNKSRQTYNKKLSRCVYAATLLTIGLTGITAIFYINRLNVLEKDYNVNIKSKKQTEMLSVSKPLYFQQTERVHKKANTDITYDLCHSFSSTINGIKMMQFPLTQILNESLIENDLTAINNISNNLFAERTIVDDKFFGSNEHIRFHDTLKPFKFLENVPILNYISNICITATENWIIDWTQNRAECLIQNESLRWTFSVDELIIIQESNTNNSLLHKALFVNTFIPIPSFMFSKYKTSSDCCMDCIEKLAAVYASNHCS